MQETFISYKRFRWLWITAVGLLVCTTMYALNSPVGGNNGGTALGYAFGTIAALGIALLMAYAARKRAYRSSLGTVEGWLAAHVWIGIGLILLVPLHSGFSFGLDVHTTAYVLMVGTIATGIWGAVNYSRLSGKITAHRGGATDATMLERIGELGKQAEALCAGKSEAFLQVYNAFDVALDLSLWSIIVKERHPSVNQKAAAVMLSVISDAEQRDAIAMIGLLDQRLDLIRSLLEQARIKALLKLWLYTHIPLSCALCVALAIHIVVVLFYR